MNRREFCKCASVVGGAIVLSPLLNACNEQPSNTTPTMASKVPTSTSTATSEALPKLSAPVTQADKPENGTASSAGVQDEVAAQPTSTQTDPALNKAMTPACRIALVRSNDRMAAVAQALALLEPATFAGKDVLLKPNFNSADPSPGSTHPDILRAILSKLNELGAGPITLVDRSGMGDTRRVMEQIGVNDLIRGYDCRAVVLDELGEEEWVLFRQPGLHWQDGYPIPKLLLDASIIVQTCNLKTHRYGGHFTLSLKNSVGLVAKTIVAGGHNYMTELHNSPYQRLMIAEINAAYEPDLIVMDGVEAFVSGGPAEGKRVNPGVVLAGHDRVAMDAVGVAILRMYGTTPEVSRGRIFEQEQIARAAALGLGVTGPEQIEFITLDSQSARFAAQLQEALAA